MVFVLGVWSGGCGAASDYWNEGEYAVGRFDPVDAIGRWDANHIAAYLAWCEKPFWP